MKEKIKRLLILIFILINFLFININNANASDNPTGEQGFWGTSIDNVPVIDNTGDSPSGYVTPNGEALPPNVITGFPSHCSVVNSSCTPTAYVIKETNQVTYNFYDMNDNSIFGENSLKSFLAGTQFGAKIYEERTATWKAFGTITQELECWQLKYSYMHYTCNKKGECYDMPVYEIETYPSTSSSWSRDCQDTANEMGYNRAKAAVEKGSSYSLKLNNPNDSRCANIEKYRNQLEQELEPKGIKVTEYCEPYEIDAIPGKTSEPLSNPVIKRYYYEMYGSCIDVKTGSVRYVKKGAFNDYVQKLISNGIISKEESNIRISNMGAVYIKKEEYEKAIKLDIKMCYENEYYVLNDYENEEIRHWHVFIPLNLKESEGIQYELTPNKSTEQNWKICQSIIENNKNTYMKYITPIDGNAPFEGDINKDKEKVKGGCYYRTIIPVPVKQLFYNEVEDKDNKDESILIGFKFYYRPIDINNPFPNGIANDSYWKLWEDDKKTGKEEPKLEESFKELTYATNALSSKAIEEYTKKNELKVYPDWSKLDLDGTSKFITDNLIRNVKNDSYYALGCSEINQCKYYKDKDGKKVENPLYQPECTIDKTVGVCP